MVKRGHAAETGFVAVADKHAHGTDDLLEGYDLGRRPALCASLALEPTPAMDW
jgi:hypothetical protein